MPLLGFRKILPKLGDNNPSRKNWGGGGHYSPVSFVLGGPYSPVNYGGGGGGGTIFTSE